MRTNEIKHRLNQGGHSIGTFFLEFNTTGIGRLAAEAGSEFGVFDMEHSGWTLESIRMLIASTRSSTMIPLVRVPASDYHFIARVLDMGAMGIMIPMVESGEQAHQIALAAKYPPMGRRGAAFCIAHDDYTVGNVAETMESANRESMLLAQIETLAGLNNCDAIAAVNGIDVLWVGQFDLSSALGIPGQFNHPKFLDALRHVVETCRRRNKIPGMMCDPTNGKQLLELGFRMIAYSTDLWIFQAALRTGITELKSAASAIASNEKPAE